MLTVVLQQMSNKIKRRRQIISSSQIIGSFHLGVAMTHLSPALVHEDHPQYPVKDTHQI